MMGTGPAVSRRAQVALLCITQPCFVGMAYGDVQNVTALAKLELDSFTQDMLAHESRGGICRPQKALAV